MMLEKRRQFIKHLSCFAAASVFLPAIDALALQHGRKKILLRNCWQTINIGDIAHVFGIMELFIKYIPDVEIILWPVLIDNGVEQLIRKTYPDLKIVNGRFDLSKGKPDTAELQHAFDECSLMIYGSGWYYEKSTDLRSWWNTTGKPFGVYGDTVQELSPELQDLFNHASFFYCRDTKSLRYLKSLNLKCPVQEFGPDSTFGIRLHNDKKAEDYLRSAGLKKGEFICVIPRLRYTPNWKMKGYAPSEEEKWRYELSLHYKEADAKKLREIITAWVQRTGLKVLACPEVAFQVELAKETLVDPLPPEIKKNVVWRDSFWLTDEAASVYARSRAVVSLEIHSTIIAVTERVPAIHIKHPTDTRKGQMWRDIGLADWYFEMDETPASQVIDTLLDVHNNYPKALKKLDDTKSFLEKVQKGSMETIKSVVLKSS